MATRKVAPKGPKKGNGRSAKGNGRTILRLGKVGKIPLADIRRAVREVRKRHAAAGI